MKLFKNKTGEALTIIVIVIIIVLFLTWVVSVGSRECKSNSDCNSGYYCGSDFACHQIPTIEKTIVKNNLLVPSIILGIAIIIAAIILKWGKLPLKKTEDEPKEEQKNNLLKLP